MAVHERLTRVPKRQLEQIGWTKARELVRVARREGQNFDCAPWVHKATQMPREEFRQAVENYVTGRETEPWELIYFKLYKSQLPIIEQALERAALMLGSDKSRGYCLEMICADFLAGISVQEEDQQMLICTMARLYCMLPEDWQDEFLSIIQQVPCPT